MGSLLSELAAPVSRITLGRAGLQFFLQDAESLAGQQEEGSSSGSADSSSGSGSGGIGGRRPSQAQPLLYRLSQDNPGEGLLFISALAAFETRTLYANSSGDHLVGWANSSLRRLGELPHKDGRGTGVIHEDPLEAAWAPAQRALLRAMPAARELHAGEARQVSQDAVLAAGTARQLAASGEPEPDADAGAGSAGGTPAAAEAAAAAGGGPVGSVGGQGEQEAHLQQQSAEVAAEEGATEAVPAAPSSSSFNDCDKGGSGSISPRAGSSSSGRQTLPQGEQQVEEMLTRLQALNWRRVDCCFGATLLPILSHQHIQMQRWWLNWAGHAVIKHLALQLQAMEQLRKQQQQPQQQPPVVVVSPAVKQAAGQAIATSAL